MVIAFGGALSLSRVLWKSEYSRSFHACILLSLCIHFLSFSCHVPFIGMHFHSFSFPIPFMFIPMCIHVLSSSFHVHAGSFHFAFMSFHFLSKVMEMAFWLGQGTPPTYDIVRRKFATKRQTERERESGRERERASWMPNAMVTAGNTGTTG